MLKLIHKLTRQYFKERCSTTHSYCLAILDCIINHLLTYSSDYFELVDTRDDMFLYPEQFSNNVSQIDKMYVLRDKTDGMYLYFYCLHYWRSFIGFTLSKKYDNTKNILRQEGIPLVSAKASALPVDPEPLVYLGEYYGFMLALKLPIDVIGDFYFINSGRSFAIFLPQSFETMGKYGNEVAPYFIYDASSSYHVDDNRIVSIHSSKCDYYRLGTLQKDVIADTGPYHSNETNYICLAFVAGDTFDTGMSGYYSNDTRNFNSSAWGRYRKHEDYAYVIVTDIPLNEPKFKYYKRKDDPQGIPHQYDELDPNETYISALVSYFDGYTVRREYGTPTAAEIMYRSNGAFAYLDLNSGTNYYSGMLSTLNSSTIAIPNFVSILREPAVLGTMSPVQESTFMYLVDMSKIATGEIVRVVDNSGNSIKLMCFPASMSEIRNPGNKLFGVGIRLEEFNYIESCFDMDTMELARTDINVPLLTSVNETTGIQAYMGNIVFNDYLLGTILLKLSFRTVDSLRISYTNEDGTYIQTVEWDRKDFIDRMESGTEFNLLRDAQDDFWFIDAQKSTNTILVCARKNCGIVDIECVRRN